MSRCVETLSEKPDAIRCERDEPCGKNHYNRRVGDWPATTSYCNRFTDGNVHCARDDGHEGECRPRGWIQNEVRTVIETSIDPDYLLWGSALIATLVAIGQLAAERERQKQNGHRFQWLEID